MIRKVLMAATVIVLVLLNIITPRLIGRETEVSSLPKIVVDYANNNTTVYVHSAFGDHRYTNITIHVQNESVGWSNVTTDIEIYSLTIKVPIQVTNGFFLKVVVYDDQSGYEYNCTVIMHLDEEKIEIIEDTRYYTTPPFMKTMREVEK
jgi:uncharacterized protein (UPF0333 family)